MGDLEDSQQALYKKILQSNKKGKRIDEKPDYERPKSKFECDICGDTYFTERALEVHTTLCKLESEPKDSKDENLPQESSREPLSKKRRLSGPSEEEVRDLQQNQQEPQDDKVQRKLQLIEPLPQPQRKAYQRGISCDTAVKLMDSFRIPKKQTPSPSTSRYKRLEP